MRLLFLVVLVKVGVLIWVMLLLLEVLLLLLVVRLGVDGVVGVFVLIVMGRGVEGSDRLLVVFWVCVISVWGLLVSVVEVMV